MERDFDELKAVFAQKRSSVPLWQHTSEKAIPVLSALKTGYVRTCVVFVLTAVAIVVVDKLSPPTVTTSAEGFRILLGCALYYALSNVYLLYRLGRIKPTLPVLQAIEQLERHKKLTIRMLTYGELFYTVVLSAGVYLYVQALMPLLEKEHPLVIPCVLSAYILWAACYTLLIRRRHLRKELRVLETYMQTLKSER